MNLDEPLGIGPTGFPSQSWWVRCSLWTSCSWMTGRKPFLSTACFCFGVYPECICESIMSHAWQFVRVRSLPGCSEDVRRPPLSDAVAQICMLQCFSGRPRDKVKKDLHLLRADWISHRAIALASTAAPVPSRQVCRMEIASRRSWASAKPSTCLRLEFPA